MSRSTFQEQLKAMNQSGRYLCVGLDSDLRKIPALSGASSIPQLSFNQDIVDAVGEFAAAFKINSAFYEAQGSVGIEALIGTVAYIHETFPSVSVVLDAKRGDIGSSNVAYSTFAFSTVDADALTIHPYLGKESAEEFLREDTRGIFVLCRTSNPGAGEFQDLMVAYRSNQRPVFEAVALAVENEWNTRGNCGLVVGATYPEELRRVSELAPHLPLLIPGVGTQGGDIEQVVEAAQLRNGHTALINSSRGIIFASTGSDFAIAARLSAKTLHDQISTLAGF